MSAQSEEKGDFHYQVAAAVVPMVVVSVMVEVQVVSASGL